MKHNFPELPYSRDALQPVLSAETLSFHHGKHHKKYIDETNRLLEELANAETEPDFSDLTLEQILLAIPSGPLFNNAAQAWNHEFYWNSLRPPQPGVTAKFPSELDAEIRRSFGNLEDFKAKFTKAAAGVFGSGWAWLVKDAQGALSIRTTSNAENPLRDGYVPLLTCDVWEHAYYIDYRNERPKYVEGIYSILNWEFAALNLKKPLPEKVVPRKAA
jgi:Fe-Mn family superoxide dismutase